MGSVATSNVKEKQLASSSAKYPSEEKVRGEFLINSHQVSRQKVPCEWCIHITLL